MRATYQNNNNIIQIRRLVPLVSLVFQHLLETSFNLKGSSSMPQIQVDQRKIHTLYLVKIINAKDSRSHGSVVMTLEKHGSKTGDLGSTPGRNDIYCFFYLIILYDNIL